MGMDVATAGAIYGLYTGLVYLLALPGGWVADNLWGQRKAVFVGGMHHRGRPLLAGRSHRRDLLPRPDPDRMRHRVAQAEREYGGGGSLYPEGGARRDAGFSLFYMGINIGAFFGPLVTSFLGEGYNWHWGFSVAGFGMVLGLIQYKRGERHLAEAGLLALGASAAAVTERSRRFFGGFFALVATSALFGWLVARGTIPLTLPQIAGGLATVILIIVVLYFVYLIGFGGHTAEEKKRLVVIFWLFLLAACFWSGFEQAGSSLNLFAAELTDRTILGWEMPAGFLQSVNPIMIIVLAPVFGWLWVWLAEHHANPSIPVKFGLGLVGLAAGFLVLAWGAANASPETPVSPAWLVVTYFLHTSGELALSPVGLSSITKLSPVGRVGQMMGVWFVGAALGNVFAGLVAGGLEDLPAFQIFRTVAMISGGIGVFALLLSPGVKRLMERVE